MKTKHYVFSFISSVVLAFTAHAGTITSKDVPVELNASPITCGANIYIAGEGNEMTNSCTFTVSASVNANVLCNGGANGSASASGSSGITPYTYLWSNKSTNATASGLSAGTYTVTARDSSGCTATASVSITQPKVLNVTTTVDSNVKCNGQSHGIASANPTGGTSPYSYSWSNGGNGSNLSAGTYTVTVTDNNGCTATASVNITQPPQLAVIITSVINVKCNGYSTGSATANAATGGTTPYTYVWSPAGGTNPIATNLIAGTYTLTVTDDNGCTATASIAITQPQAISLTSDSTKDNGSCNGSAWLKVAGGVSPYTYLWSPGGETSDTIKNQCAGPYCCTVTDNNGCKDTLCVTINLSTGINNASSSSGITIYPNPTSGKFMIQSVGTQNFVSRQWSVEVYNIFGEKVFSKLSDVQFPLSIDLSEQPNQIYLIRILNSNGTLVSMNKVVKTN